LGWDELATVEPLGPAVDVLQIGCGNSLLHAQLAAAGANMTSVDFAASVVAQMADRFPVGRFLVADARALPFLDASFDLVVEKGTIDALAAGSSGDLEKVVAEASRVLRPGGRFISVGFAEREPVKEQPWTKFRREKLIHGPDKKIHFVSVGTK
jgi:endothelin-converting enzyme